MKNVFKKYLIIISLIPNNVLAATPNDLNELTRFGLKIVLVIAAAMVPVMIGDKLSGGISNMISNKTKGMKDSTYKSSKFGASRIAARKTREGNALGNAFGRRASGNILTRTVGDTSFGKAMGWSTADRAGAREAAIKQFMPSAENMTKRQRDEYLKKYANDDGSFNENMKKQFDNDYRAQAILLAQGESGLLNDNAEDRFLHQNQMRARLAGLGHGEAVGQIKKAGGYDFMMKDFREAAMEVNGGDEQQAIQQQGGLFRSTMRDAGTPEKINSWGSEAGARLVQVYNAGDEQTKEMILDGIKRHFTAGNIEQMYASDQSGGKARGLFNQGALYNVETHSPENFSSLLELANHDAYNRSQELNRIYNNLGTVSQPTHTDQERIPPTFPPRRQ